MLNYRYKEQVNNNYNDNDSIPVEELDKINKQEEVEDIVKNIENARDELQQAIHRLERLSDTNTALELQSFKTKLLIVKGKFEVKHEQT